MAKRRNGSFGRDDNTTIAKRSLPRTTLTLPLLALNPTEVATQILTELEDRRLHSADYSVRPARAQQRRDARLVAKGPSLHSLAFQNPRHVAMCIRRKIRREVLHALKVAGGKGMKKYRRNYWSEVKC